MTYVLLLSIKSKNKRYTDTPMHKATMFCESIRNRSDYDFDRLHRKASEGNNTNEETDILFLYLT